MTKPKLFPHLLLLTLILINSFIGCKNDDASLSILPYDSDSHLYGTFDNNEGKRWEVVIDPVTGQFDKVPGTELDRSGWLGPIGTKMLTSFNENKRLFIDLIGNQTLKIQDLETMEYSELKLRDTSLGISIDPSFIRFGENDNELYILHLSSGLWRVNIESGSFEELYSVIPLSSIDYIRNFFYVKKTHQLLIAADTFNGNAPEARNIILFDLETSSVVDRIEIPKSLGFVQHPMKESFFCLRVPEDGLGYRLIEIRVAESNIELIQKSNSNLELDVNIFNAAYLQTIHSGTNSYVCKGVSPLSVPQGITLFSIDLDSGELINRVTLNEAGTILKLAAE